MFVQSDFPLDKSDFSEYIPIADFFHHSQAATFMDLELFNYSAIARRIGVSIMYTHHLLSGARRSEKRLAQIAGVLNTSVEKLKAQIAQAAKERKSARGRAKTAGARAHTATHFVMSTRHPSANGGASARLKVRTNRAKIKS